ncbi:SRPBCC family protein [Mycobacterium sp. IS-3022]|uniref:SRPBCC family protein n=1 Tax=Mycobacterium sp. IS-3022 TaxID=1772277 RepID=UPI0007416E10|nr:SRPBCC family protein [Mycobacterium sp. IS-3022]KUI01608.1 polyketide cyclase [Mycobacterium sp. IS-3022]
MTRWYPLAAADADFLVSAPHVFRYEKRFAAPPERVWESMVSDESLAAWGPSVKSVTWTSPRPFGIGTTREAVPAGGATLRERYFQWEDGHRKSFYVYESTLPLFKRFAEDYIVDADGDSTLFTWVVAVEPKRALALPVKVLAPLLKAGLGRIPADGQKYFAAKA